MKLTDKQLDLLVIKIKMSDPVKRNQWMKLQPPLLQALDQKDAEDDTNYLSLIRTP